MLDYSTKVNANRPYDVLFFSSFPTAVFAKQRVPREQLQLVPLVPMRCITVAEKGTGIDTHNSITILKKKHNIFITAPPLLNAKKLGSEDALGSVHPFFWVFTSKKTDKRSEANIDVYTKVFDGFKFPVLYNTQPLEPLQQLVMFDSTKKGKESKVSVEPAAEVGRAKKKAKH